MRYLGTSHGREPSSNNAKGVLAHVFVQYVVCVVELLSAVDVVEHKPGIYKSSTHGARLGNVSTRKHDRVPKRLM